MRGIVLVEDRCAVHVIPRDEIRYAEVVTRDGDGWALKYQLAGTLVVRAVEWKGESRPESLKQADPEDTINTSDYNQLAAHSLLTMLTRGHRDLHLERRAADNIFLVRSGLVENDARTALCRQFVAEMARTMLQFSSFGPEQRLKMLHEIRAAARDLTLPDWYPLVETPS